MAVAHKAGAHIFRHKLHHLLFSSASFLGFPPPDIQAPKSGNSGRLHSRQKTPAGENRPAMLNGAHLAADKAFAVTQAVNFIDNRRIDIAAV